MDVLISIRPEWCEKIANGEKTIEIRKTRPKLEEPFKCYIYCTKPKRFFTHGGIMESSDDLYRIPFDAPYDAGKIKYGYSGELMCCHAEYNKDNFLNGKVIGEFICGKIISWGYDECPPFELSDACLKYSQIREYAPNDKDIYGWHISNIEIYDKPQMLECYGFKRPPQSWCYVEEDKIVHI